MSSMPFLTSHKTLQTLNKNAKRSKSLDRNPRGLAQERSSKNKKLATILNMRLPEWITFGMRSQIHSEFSLEEEEQYSPLARSSDERIEQLVTLVDDSFCSSDAGSINPSLEEACAGTFLGAPGDTREAQVKGAQSVLSDCSIMQKMKVNQILDVIVFHLRNLSIFVGNKEMGEIRIKIKTLFDFDGSFTKELFNSVFLGNKRKESKCRDTEVNSACYNILCKIYSFA